MSLLASHSAVSLRVNQQIAIKNWRFEQLALVRSVSFQIANVLDLDELARRVTRLILHTFQFYYVAIFTVEKSDETLRFRASAKVINDDPLQDYQPQGFLVHSGEGIVGFVAETGLELVAPDVKQEPHFRFIDILPETQSEIALPLKVENKILGVLDVQSNQLDAFHDMDIMVLRALADSIALAIEGTHLLETAHRRADQISTVVEVSRAITSILDLETLLREVVHLIQKRFGYSFVHLFTVNPESRKVIFQAGSGARSDSMKAMGIAYDIDDPLGIIPWVARNGKTVLANDVTKDERYRPSLLLPAETNSELTLPLVFGKETLGILDIQSNQRNVFEPEDLSLFEAFASNVAIAIRNATLYYNESWRRKIAESLRDVAGLLSTNVALDQVLDLILKELERSLSWDVAVIWLCEDSFATPGESKIFHLVASHGCDCNKEKMDDLRELDPETNEWLSHTLKVEAPAIRSPVEKPGPIGTAMGFPNEYSSIAVPLKASGQIVGVLALADEDEGQYGSESQEMVATIAGYAAVAIENTRLYSSAKEQAWVSSVLLQVTEATQSLDSIDELNAAIVRLTPMLVGIKGCSIFFWEKDTRKFEYKVSHGFTPAQEDIFSRPVLKLQNSPAFEKLEATRSAVLVRNPQDELSIPESLASAFEGMMLVLLPIETRQNFLGAFVIVYDVSNLNTNNIFSGEEEQFAVIQGIAQQLATAIENINLLESRQEEAYVTAVLLQVAQAVVSSNNLIDTLESIVNIMPILVGVDVCSIYMWEGEKKLFVPDVVYAGSPITKEELRQATYRPGDFPILDAIWQTDTPLMTSFNANAFSSAEWKNLPVPERNQDLSREFNALSALLMGFPLSAKGEHYGIMLAIEKSGTTKFRARRFEIISGIAQQASIAIQNDLLQKEMVGRERFEQEIRLAREIQRTFLPTEVPELEGWELDIRWRPAHQVGGDFYDFFELPGNHIGLVIADVSDKGMAAALYMAVTRTLIRSTITDSTSPSKVLERVNDLLLINSKNGLFVTAFYAIMDIDSGELVYANAGHNQPLLRNAASGNVNRLVRGGAALGALGGEIHLIDHSIKINPGDSLVLFTDGATEAFSPSGEIFGEERLRITIGKADGYSACQMLDLIDATVGDFMDGEPAADDTTLVAIHRLR